LPKTPAAKTSKGKKSAVKEKVVTKEEAVTNNHDELNNHDESNSVKYDDIEFGYLSSKDFSSLEEGFNDQVIYGDL
jgi:hypothetical protein